MQKELLAKIENHNRKIKEAFNLENNVITKEDIWVGRDFKGTGEDLIEYFSRIDPERIGYYCNLVEFHKKQYNL